MADVTTGTLAGLPGNQNIGPLTATFTAPASCDTSSTYSVSGVNAGYYQQGPLLSDQGCMPSSWSIGGFYSPGVCPDGYTEACLGTSANVATTICCPNQQASFGCVDDTLYGRFFCNSAFTPTVTMTNVIGEGDISGTADSVTETQGAIWAYGVQVRNDAPVSTTSHSRSTTTKTNSATPSPHSSGLSGGAIAGIVIGVLAVFGIVGAGAFVFWRRRRQYNTPPAQDEVVGKGIPMNPAELGYDGWHGRHELDEQRSASELPPMSSSPQSPRPPSEPRELPG